MRHQVTGQMAAVLINLSRVFKLWEALGDERDFFD